MEKEHTGTFIEIDKNLIKDIKDYCKLNKLQLTSYINDILKDAFMKEKYGEAPLFMLKSKKEENIPIKTEEEPLKLEDEEKSIEDVEQPINEVKQPLEQPNSVVIGKKVRKVKVY